MTSDQNIKPIGISTNASPKKGGRTIVNVVIVIILIVSSIAGSILAFEVFSGNIQSGVHFGFVTLSTVEGNTGMKLNESGIITNFTTGNSSISGGEYVFYNATISIYYILVNATIEIGIIEFSNDTNTMKFIKTVLTINLNENISLINGSYNDFKYYYDYLSKNGSNFRYVPNLPQGIAFGYKGNFVFFITDFLIPSSNFNALIKAQINAMSYYYPIILNRFK